MTARPRTAVLIVDDEPTNRLVLEKLLSELDIDLVSATSGEQAVARTLERDFAVVLMDVEMPGMDGFEAVDRIRSDCRTRHVPVVFVTALNDDRSSIARGYEVGAVDYLFKPVDPHVVRSKVRVFVELHVLRIELEERNRQLAELSEKLRESALTDPLTGLRNRRYLSETVAGDLALVRRAAYPANRRSAPENASVGFLMIDVDHFKAVNDGHGHHGGDAVLVGMARRLEEAVRESDEIIRWGGEEFLVVLRHTDRSSLQAVADRIRESVAGSGFAVPGGAEVSVTCSVGSCAYPVRRGDGWGWEEVVGVADAALMLAKSRGRNRCVGVEIVAGEHSPELAQEIARDLETAAGRGLVDVEPGAEV